MLDKSAIAKIAQKFSSKGQIDKAIAEWEKLLKESPDVNAYNAVGDLYLKKNAKREAIEVFTKAANIYRQEGFYLKAMALYKKILNISPTDRDALLSLAELNAEKGFTAIANDTFRTAAEIHIRQGENDVALEIYKRMLKYNPSDIEIKTKIAGLYLTSGLKEKAVKEFLSIASDYVDNGDYENAREFYNKAINIDPRNISSFIGLGKIARLSGDTKQAYEYINNALTISPDNNEALHSYAALAIETNDIDNAKQALTKLIESAPSNIQYKKLLGSIYLKEGLLEKALDELLPYIDEELNAGRFDEAEELIKNFREIRPVEVKRRLIIIYKAKNDKNSAINELRDLAGILESEGLPEEALQAYREILQLDISLEAVKEKIKELEKTLRIVPEKDREKEFVEEAPHITKEPSRRPAPAKTPGNFEEKLAEAAFYAQQGLKEEAIKLYEELLSFAPGNEDIIKKINSLRTPREREAKEKLQVKIPVPEEELSAKAATEEETKGVFNKFKKGIDEKLEEDDFESRYNLGIAYKEMGMIDDAIKEFQFAARNPLKGIQCSSMLAACYMEKKDYAGAVNEFRKMLEATPQTDGNYLNLKFDLANAYRENKEYDNALRACMEIYTQNPDFKNIKSQIEKIKSLMEKDTDGKTKSKKDRVSYI